MHSKYFIFTIQSYSSDLLSRKKSAFPKKKEIESLVDSLGKYLKAFDRANKISQIPLPLDVFGEFTSQKLVTKQLFGLELCAVRQDTFYLHQEY